MQTILRREKILKTLILLIQALNPYSPQERTVDNEIFINIFEIFSKLTFNCPKNQEYFMKKNCYKLTEPIFKLSPVDLNILRPLLFTLANCCDQNDYQLVFWCDDFLAKINQRVAACLLDAVRMIEKLEDGRAERLKELEVYLIFLSRAVRGCGSVGLLLEEIVLTVLEDRKLFALFDAMTTLLIACNESESHFQ